MAWIETIPLERANKKLLDAVRGQRALYPKEYEQPTNDRGESIIETHTLIPDAMYHAFATFGVLMSPDLPLDRRQHEMIATVVSVTNDCFY